jgi:hypothetical protein
MFRAECGPGFYDETVQIDGSSAAIVKFNELVVGIGEGRGGIG